MAAPLNSPKSPKITKGKTRKAKGAASSGGAKPARRLKPQPGAGATTPSDADVRRHQQERLVALTARHRESDNKIDVANVAMDELRAEKKLVRTAIENAGFPLALFDDGYKKLKLRTNKVDLAHQERLRDLMWEAWGLPRVGAQGELDLAGVPEAARPALHWRGVGYQAGIMGEPCEAPEGCVGPDLQEFAAGWGDGQTILGQGLKRLETEKPAAAAPPLVAEGDGRPDWSGWPADHQDWSGEQKDAFADWFENVPVDVTPAFDHPGAAARFAWLEANAPTEDAEPFEASPEELEGQQDRQRLQERKGSSELLN